MDILAYGMVTALGTDAATSCASARAGLVRSRPLEHFRIRSGVTGEPEPIIAHPVLLLTNGFEGEARLLRLIHGAMADVAAQAGTHGLDLADAPIYLSLPASDRPQSAAGLIADETVRSTRAANAEQPPDARAEFARAAGILARAAALARWSRQPELAFLTTAGNAGGIEALRAAAVDLSSGRCRRAIVIGADSLLDATTLNWLQVSARLKCDAVPNGLQPGEAACALLLSAAEPEVAQAHIAKTAVGDEEASLDSGRVSSGGGLARALASADTGTRDHMPWLLSDHNGETYRASELGHAIVRLRAQSPRFASPHIEYPAISFGDTGAASALVGIVWAIRAFARGYAPGGPALVAATSEGRLRAAASVQAAART
jgi:3-oxoacyl-[acyl-carrier-protein] synthase-1